MGFKKILFGEDVPDKDDPKYKARHEKDVESGKRFAEALHLDRAAAYIQRFATQHSKLFLVCVFGFVIFCVALNLYRISIAVSQKSKASSAVERVSQETRHRISEVVGHESTE